MEKIIITTPEKRRGKEYDAPRMEIEIIGTKMYARTLGNDSISARMDVTVLWDFFKQVQDYTQNKATLTPSDTLEDKNGV